MIAVPRGVMRIQSPWRQMPGYMSKYASRRRSPSGSFQNATGIDGSGAVSTSSPTSSITGSPSSSNASTLAPSERACSSPSYTGSVGTPPTNALHTSVPPLAANSQVSRPSSSYTQLNPSGDNGRVCPPSSPYPALTPPGDNGEPVEPTARSADRSRPSAGFSSPVMQL